MDFAIYSDVQEENASNPLKSKQNVIATKRTALGTITNAANNVLRRQPTRAAKQVKYTEVRKNS